MVLAYKGRNTPSRRSSVGQFLFVGRLSFLSVFRTIGPSDYSDWLFSYCHLLVQKGISSQAGAERTCYLAVGCQASVGVSGGNFGPRRCLREPTSQSAFVATSSSASACFNFPELLWSIPPELSHLYCGSIFKKKRQKRRGKRSGRLVKNLRNAREICANNLDLRTWLLPVYPDQSAPVFRPLLRHRRTVNGQRYLKELKYSAIVHQQSTDHITVKAALLNVSPEVSAEIESTRSSIMKASSTRQPVAQFLNKPSIPA
ncbi:hypothetical protein DPX16_3500 [Anabarilius grahami]|uniref:Uncharacterized protein n=1 Tax=Anabarilius grahami TaxID=495550 RepID=A0A3N0Y6P5_ANAGA|nr:hypothetical protein DPX16_3500 [Anabarilius grahami]